MALLELGINEKCDKKPKSRENFELINPWFTPQSRKTDPLIRKETKSGNL